MVEAVAGFDWDDGNREKCRKHGVTVEQIESLFRASGTKVFPDPAHSSSETRFLGIGPTATGRYILVAYTYRTVEKLRLIRPISARFMHAKEVKHYEAQSKGSGQAASTEN